jgi:hypothetical protein
MGLTIHYQLRSTAKTAPRAADLVGRMRQLALDLPFESVSELVALRGRSCTGNVQEMDPAVAGARMLFTATQVVPLPWSTKWIESGGVRRVGQQAYAEVPPLAVYAFEVCPGPGCETAELGLARYAREIKVKYDPHDDARFLDERFNFRPEKWRRSLRSRGLPERTDPSKHVRRRTLRPRLGGWRWGSFCKTQYASNPRYGGLPNFLRCHVGMITLLERIAELPCLKVEINDEGRYGSSPPGEARLAGAGADSRHDLAALAREVGEWNSLIAAGAGALRDHLSGGLEAPILSFPDFEQLEFRGQSAPHLDEFLKPMKAAADAGSTGSGPTRQ